MKDQLVDQRAKLLSQLVTLDEKIEVCECQTLTDEAAECVQKAKELLQQAAEKDREQKRKELAERDAALKAKRERLIAQIEEQERLYREAICRGLAGLAITDPWYTPNEAEKAVLDDPQKAPIIGLSKTFYRLCALQPTLEFTAARRNLARLRSEFSNLGA